MQYQAKRTLTEGDYDEDKKWIDYLNKFGTDLDVDSNQIDIVEKRMAVFFDGKSSKKSKRNP